MRWFAVQNHAAHIECLGWRRVVNYCDGGSNLDVVRWGLASVFHCHLDYREIVLRVREMRVVHHNVGAQLPLCCILHHAESLFGNACRLACRSCGAPSFEGRICGSTNGEQTKSRLDDTDPPLRVCQCYGLFRSLRHAPLLAQISVFAVLGVGTAGVVGAAFFALYRGRGLLGLSLMVIAIRVWLALLGPPGRWATVTQ